MDLKLENKRVLVTGSTGGIGEGIAKRFAEEGAKVVINGRRRDQAERVVAEIRAAGGMSFFAVGDLSTDEGAADVIEIVQEAMGGIDILVNNAAGGGHSGDMEKSSAEWAEAYDINVLSMVRLIQRLLPGMEEQGWGRIINISSAAAVNPPAGMAIYSVTKAAINNLTVAMSKAIQGEGVTVNCVSPGAIITPSMIEVGLAEGMGESAEEIEAAMDQMMGSTTPLGRMGRIDEVADVALFIASPRASYINGANIRVDGGYVPTIN